MKTRAPLTDLEIAALARRMIDVALDCAHVGGWWDLLPELTELEWEAVLRRFDLYVSQQTHAHNVVDLIAGVDRHEVWGRYT